MSERVLLDDSHKSKKWKKKKTTNVIKEYNVHSVSGQSFCDHTNSCPVWDYKIPTKHGAK